MDKHAKELLIPPLPPILLRRVTIGTMWLSYTTQWRAFTASGQVTAYQPYRPSKNTFHTQSGTDKLFPLDGFNLLEDCWNTLQSSMSTVSVTSLCDSLVPYWKRSNWTPAPRLARWPTRSLVSILKCTRTAVSNCTFAIGPYLSLTMTIRGKRPTRTYFGFPGNDVSRIGVVWIVVPLSSRHLDWLIDPEGPTSKNPAIGLVTPC